jgi:integrating conjugative element protein (TIGR03757 family)
MNVYRKLIALCAFLSCFCVYAQQPVHVEVFSDRWIDLPPIAGLSVTLYDLSAPEKVKRAHPMKFSADPAAAKQEAHAYFQTTDGRAYIAKMREAHQGKIQSIKYRLEKFPAVVFERGKYVVYGITDLSQAVILYDKHVAAITEGGRDDS